MTFQLPPGVSLGNTKAGGVLADSDWHIDDSDDFTPLSFAPKAINGRIVIRLSDLVKVGKEGYIHGYICVRPPCGEAVEAEFSGKTGEVRHDGVRIGKMRKNDDGTYSMMHTATDGTKTKLTARYATRADAAKSVALFHNVDVLHGEASDQTVKDSLQRVKSSLSSGDTDSAASILTQAETVAGAGGDKRLASHIADTRAAITDGPKSLDAARMVEAKIPEEPKIKAPEEPKVPEAPELHVTAGNDDLKQDVSYAGLDVKAVQDELNGIADSLTDPDRYVTDALSVYPTDSNFRDMARDISRPGGEDMVLKPSINIFGEHVKPEAYGELTEYIRQLRSKQRGDGIFDKVPSKANAARIGAAIERAKALRAKILAADTTPPLRAGVPVKASKDLAGSLDDNLAPDEAARLREYIKRPAFKLQTDEDVADMRRLKGTYVMNALEKAGLPHNAAYIMAGGVGAPDPGEREGDNGLSSGGVNSLVGGWSTQGDGVADTFSRKYDESMAMDKPPELLDTDFAGAARQFNVVYGDTSTEANARRNAAKTYWEFRAQKLYTGQVLKEIKAPAELKLSRYIGGSYADKIRSSDKLGLPWAANTRTLSSWADPKGVRSAKSFVAKTQNGEPLKVTQSVPRENIFMHWRGEPTLRNEVRALGEVVPVGVTMSNENTVVGE